MITWKDIDVCIPAVDSIAERAESLARLLAELKRQAPKGNVIVSRQRVNGAPDAHEACDNIAHALEQCSRPWVLYLEDDCELSRSFGVGVLAALNSCELPAVIAFFSRYDMAPDGLHDDTENWSRPQCTAMPLELAQEWAQRLATWPKDAPRGRWRCTERPLRNAVLERGLRIWLHVPSLVQHGAVPSAWGHPSVSSPTYRG
jgi:hypothetical protein